MGNPYEDPDLQKVLSRKYKIADITWSDSDTAGTTLATVDPLAGLMGIQNIADKLTQFRWLRTDIAVEIRINATPFHIGAIMISYLPRMEAGSTAWAIKMDTIAQKSQNHGIVLSASSLNNISFTMKREAPLLYDFIDAAGVFDGCLGTMDFTVLNPLLLASAGSASPINVAVFASFVNPKVAGYGYFPILNPPMRFEQHSSVTGESLERAAGAIIGPEAKSLYSSVLRVADSSSFGEALTAIAPAMQFVASMGLSKPNDLTTMTPAVLDEWRDLNYAHGSTHATKFALHPEASLGDMQGEFLQKNKISEFISKPSLILSTTITKTDTPDTPLITIPVIPSLCHWDSSLSTFTPTPLAYASQAFVWYRGGMKFLFEFITSQFVTARFRITHWPGDSFPASIEEYAGDAVSAVVDVRGDTPFPFTVPFMSPAPYLPTHGYCFAGGGGYTNLPALERTSFITLSLINGVQQPDFDGEGVIYCNVYASAAEDMTFGQYLIPHEREPLSTSPTFVQHSLIEKFSPNFQPLVPSLATYEAGVVLPEQYTGIEELCMRYNPVTPLVGDLTVEDLSPTVTSYNSYAAAPLNINDAIMYWAFCYRWNRGGLRYKFLWDPTSVPNDRWLALTQMFRSPLESGGPMHFIVVDKELRGVVEYEIPWVLNSFANDMYQPLPIDQLVHQVPFTYLFTTSGTESPTLQECWRAVSDDFMFGHQIAMPAYPFTLPPPIPSIKGKSVGKSKAPDRVSLLEGLIDRSKDPKLDQSLGLSRIIQEKLDLALSKERAKSRPATSSQ